MIYETVDLIIYHEVPESTFHFWDVPCYGDIYICLANQALERGRSRGYEELPKRAYASPPCQSNTFSGGRVH
jgi:hypothetical protein